eukprot:3134912-Pleurochrysis_carterae.AAC.1
MVVGHGLLAGARIRTCMRNGKRAAGAPSPRRLGAGTLQQESGGPSVAKRVRSKSALEVVVRAQGIRARLTRGTNFRRRHG